MSIKNSNNTIGNWTRDLPACSAVPQPTSPPRPPFNWGRITNMSSEQSRTASKEWSWGDADGKTKLFIVITRILQNVTKNVSLGRILWHLNSNGKRRNEMGTLLLGEQLDLRDITQGKRKHTGFHSHELRNFHPSTNVTWVTRSTNMGQNGN